MHARADGSRRADRASGSASVPSRRIVVPRAPAIHAAISIADQSCSTPPNGVTTGPSRESIRRRAGPRRKRHARACGSSQSLTRPSSSSSPVASTSSRSASCSVANRVASSPGSLDKYAATRERSPRAASATRRSPSSVVARPSASDSRRRRTMMSSRAGCITSGSAMARTVSSELPSAANTTTARAIGSGATRSGTRASSCRRIACSSSCSAGLGSRPSSSTSTRRISR